MRSIITALAILIGLTFEDTFDACIEGLAENLDGLAADNVPLAIAGMNFLSAMVVYPAWHLYILPRSNAELVGHVTENYPRIWAICDSSLFYREEHVHKHDDGEDSESQLLDKSDARTVKTKQTPRGRNGQKH